MATNKRAVARRVRNKVAGIDLGTDVQIAIFAALALGGWYVYENFLSPGKTNPTGNGTTPTTVAPDLAAQTAAGDGPNYDATQYSSWADEIYAAASHWGNTFSDATTVLGILDQIDNLADMYALIQAFGTRSYSWYFGSSNYSLPGFIQANWGSSDITKFNQQLGYNNVAFTF